MGKRRRNNRSSQMVQAVIDRYTYNYYYERLLEIAISTIEWTNMPEEIDTRFLEHALATRGMAVFYRDDVLERYIALTTMIGAPLNIYNVPTQRTAFATNGYQYHLTSADSVLIFNNYLRKPIINDLEYYAAKLYKIDRIIDINMNGQKTPILLLCNENQRLAIENMYEQYDGNSPVIYGYKSQLDPDAIKALETPAEYLCDKLYDLRLQIWNEALTFLGVANTTQYKRERVIQSEIETSQGQVIANRNARINMRQQACDRINNMFGLDIGVQYANVEYPDLQSPDDVSRETFGEGGDSDE